MRDNGKGLETWVGGGASGVGLAAALGERKAWKEAQRISKSFDELHASFQGLHANFQTVVKQRDEWMANARAWRKTLKQLFDEGHVTLKRDKVNAIFQRRLKEEEKEIAENNKNNG